MRKTKHNARKVNLWKIDPHCNWCGKLTVLTRKKMSNQATLDHIKQTNPWIPGLLVRYKAPTVLACYQCNSARGKKGL
mgnify:FL=1